MKLVGANDALLRRPNDDARFSDFEKSTDFNQSFIKIKVNPKTSHVVGSEGS